ncbi:hypothetical protein BC936DRAFT_145537 [Jimgerdemannia flammicorona]|uniref:Septin-domain-containing protein n=1 Tax=Jimgerdemannia flammicorona TaxID=994334 RepID=A0A433D9R9_9FUNG|nr:hypothetical protein BC936DRAFT_145537 [Jimgerdemannia flammicorona]
MDSATFSDALPNAEWMVASCNGDFTRDDSVMALQNPTDIVWCEDGSATSSAASEESDASINGSRPTTPADFPTISSSSSQVQQYAIFNNNLPDDEPKPNFRATRIQEISIINNTKRPFGDNQNKGTADVNGSIRNDKSIKVAPTPPSRVSPIPNRARSIGQLRIMVVGDSCVGKTQFSHRLLRAIEHFSGVKRKVRTGTTEGLLNCHLDSQSVPPDVMEYFASTAYVPFIDRNSASLPVASSLPPERVPAYNITLLDTHGYGETAIPVTTMSQATAYLERAFTRTHQIYNPNTPHDNFYRLLSPDRGIHEMVDVVLYLVHVAKPVDVEYMRRLEPFACVLPVLVVDGLMEPLAMEQERTKIRKRFAKLGVTWHVGRGMDVHEIRSTRATSADKVQAVGRQGGEMLLHATQITQNRRDLDEEDKQDTTFPFVIRGGIQIDEEEEQDDFNQLCHLLFRPSKLNIIRYRNVCKFIRWLTKQEEAAAQKREEQMKKEAAATLIKEQEETAATLIKEREEAAAALTKQREEAKKQLAEMAGYKKCRG